MMDWKGNIYVFEDWMSSVLLSELLISEALNVMEREIYSCG